MADIHTSYIKEENKLNNTDFVIANETLKLHILKHLLS